LSLAFLVFALPASLAERDLSDYTFGHYTKEFGKKYAPSEIAMRESIFNDKLAEIISHNAGNHSSYTKGVNHLTDRTEKEFRKLLGYRKDLGSILRASLPYQAPSPIDMATLPASVDWRNVGAVTPVKNQGHCGSCWTFAAAESVESAFFLATGKLQELSQQQIASCTPNPTHCGGTGGCEGGIAQLAFDGIQQDSDGLATEWTYPYISYFGENFDCKYNSSTMDIGARVVGHTNVLSNDYNSLMAAVAINGPISISVDASSFSSYEKGVHDGCDMSSPDINHAVQLVGYGTDSAYGAYWLVRNSWGPFWGENGYIRIRRQTGTQVCGVDKTPQHGSGCDGGPTEIVVCGECGILYDNTYPIVSTV